MTAPLTAPCPLCETPEAPLFHEERDRRYFRCPTCALVFLDPAQRPAHEQEAARYRRHRNDASDAGYVRFLQQLIDPLGAVVPPGSRGLDYGCGPQPVLGEILAARGYAMASYDPLFFPQASLLDGPYDFVTCCEVIEHVHDPQGAFALFAHLLRAGGTLGMMTRFYDLDGPFAEWWYRRDFTHVCFYCEATMRWIAGQYGWRLTIPAPHVALFTVEGASVD